MRVAAATAATMGEPTPAKAAMTPNFAPEAASAIALLGGLVIVFVLTILALRLAAHGRQLTSQLRASLVQAERLATHDPLVGLPNRGAFRKALDETPLGGRDGPRHGLLYVDLDRFKDVNDSHGHEIGDQLLRTFTTRIRPLLRPDDVFARIGGDEFAVLRRNVGSRDELTALARRIGAALETPFDLGAHSLVVTTSIGMAMAPDGANSRTEWVQRADFALYRAKQDGRARACLFAPEMLEMFHRRSAIRRDLAAAIASGEIGALYQPIFDADGTTIVCAEALLYWNHRAFGPLPAALVISVAEESGQILPLGEFILRRACTDAMRWGDVRVAVNVSAIQFRSGDFVDQVKRILDETGLPGERLEIELTETVIVFDADLAEESMLRLRALGVRLALDDFGVGYSSLVYLRRFPFDKIKIDRTFIEMVEAKGESAMLLSAMVKMGQALGLRCTAEGIETPEQLAIVQSFGCEEAQGFLLARPDTSQNLELRLETAGTVGPRTTRSQQQRAVA
jgi:diguanylate cyclase (GGDEF)-like protein